MYWLVKAGWPHNLERDTTFFVNLPHEVVPFEIGAQCPEHGDSYITRIDYALSHYSCKTHLDANHLGQWPQRYCKVNPEDVTELLVTDWGSVRPVKGTIYKVH